MPSRLRAQLAQLGPIRAVDRVASGSPATVVLRPVEGVRDIEPIAATLALARRGLSLFRAKRAVETVLAEGSVTVHVPIVERADALASDLRLAGLEAEIAATPVRAAGE